jgi:hypothetical protein
VAGDVAGPVETVFPWTEGRCVHLLSAGALSAGRRASVAHAAAHSADLDALELALGRIFRHRLQRRIRGPAAPDVWFELE